MSRIVLTDAPTPDNVSSGQTQVYAKNGSAGLFYKQGTDPEVGPLSAGSTVTDLQTAYNGEASIATTLAKGAVSISSTLPGGPDALAVTVGGSTDASGVLVVNSGPGAAVSATALGSGNAVEVEASNTRALNVKVNGTGSGARGLAVDLTSAGSQGTGIEVSVDSTGTGFYLHQVGNGIGIDLISDSTSNEAIRVETTDPASTGDVISSTSNGAGSALYTKTTGAGNGVTVYASPGSIGRGISSEMAGTGSAVYVEKSNTGDGVEVNMINPATGSGLTVTSQTTGATFPGISVNHVGQAVGVSASMTNVVDATGFSAHLDAAGLAARGLAVDFSDTSAAGTGIVVTFSGATATGVGLDIFNTAGTNSFQAQKITMASGSTGTGIGLTHNGTGAGIGLTHNGTGIGVGIGMTGAGLAATRGLKVLATNPAAGFYGAEVDVTSTKAPLLLIQRGAGNLLEALNVATPVFTVDSAGNTTTPSVIFGGSGTITVEGDSGVTGEPINPRVSLTSGSVGVGALARTWICSIKEGGAGPWDMETAVGAPYVAVRDQQPTLIQWQNSSGLPQVLYLPDAARYPAGTEIQFWNVTPGSNITLTNLGFGGQQIRDLSSVPASQTVTPGSGRRLVALGADGWFVTGVI